MIGNSKDLNLACRNIFSVIFQWQATGNNGFLNDVSITFIDKTDPPDALRREDYWRQTLQTLETLQTMVPYGLNIEDSV